MINKALTKIFGTKHTREMKKIQPLVDQVNSLEKNFESLNDAQLQAKTNEFRQRIENGETLDSLLPEAFAACREAGKRILGMRHYDVQLIGGTILHRGSIAEMKTGEGKTLVATLPMYLNGLSGKGAHLVTVNDYLAKRDCEWMSQLYNFMGLTTGTITHNLSDYERKAAYGADITYATNNELGFDYLRDNMKYDLEDYVQRPHNFAIVDECDSILIDEARTPLIISGPSEESVDKYYEVNKIIPQLKLDVHFNMEEKSKTVSLTEEGNSQVEALLGVDNIYDPQHIELVHHIYQGLKAYHLFKKDVDYMVKDGEIVIVDEFTGRLMEGRRWSDGLHQAIEAKEGVKIKSENQTLASITFQNYFRMYNKLSGMTGTADTEAVEFKKIYNLDVNVIPTNKPIARIDADDVVYKNEKAKFKAMALDIKERHEKGQPVLVGTVSIEKSERLSRLLKNEGVTHNILNAKHHEKEAEIVAQAGRLGSVTIATNMAGRGTDIVLGGNPEALAKEACNGEADNEQYKTELEKFTSVCSEEKKKVLAAGGLYIMGTERHESRRIDNQLRGRAGRQGDPGESRFYLSLDDDLLRIFNGERIQKFMSTFNIPEDEPISARMVSSSIEGAQRKVEGHHFDIRKHLLEYDDVMNQQRNTVYEMRRSVLSGQGVDQLVLDMLAEVTSEILDNFVSEEAKASQWDFEGLQLALNKQFGIYLELPVKEKATAEGITNLVSQAVKLAFDSQRQKLGDIFPDAQKMLLLQAIDDRWKEHLQRIDGLKEGINLRAYAQKNPLIEYKKEAFMAFEEMLYSLKAEVIEKLIKIQIVSREEAEAHMAREYDDENFEFAGAPEEMEHGVSGQFAPYAQPPKQEMTMSGSPTYGQEHPDEGPKLNRAERRRQERKNKKRGR